VVGTLQQDEELEVLDTSTDGNWMQVKRSDDTTGWIFKTHLIQVESPEPPGNGNGEPPGNGNGEPPSTEIEWYKVTATALNVREGPSTSYDKVGTLLQDEVVKALDYAAANSWIKILRESDGLTGWCYAPYMVEVPAPDDGEPPGDGDEEPPDDGNGEPPGDGDGEPPGDGDGEPPDAEEWYQVTAQPSLNVREGPSTSNNKIGSLPFGAVVKALEKSADGSWIKIYYETDDLTGWGYATYLELTDAPTPPGDGNGEPPGNGDGEPPDTEVEWYRVTASPSLNVREGPSTSTADIGSLPFGSVVKALEKNADGSWIKIYRVFDALTGWCFASYLELVDTPPDNGGTPPATQTGTWYQVKPATLNVREGPSTNDEKLGSLNQSEIVVAFETNEDGSWARVQRFDGLVGWCAVSYLNNLGTTAPNQLTQKIFNGVTYFRKESESPRKMVAHVLAIDMRASGLKCLVTPPSHSSGLMCTRKTSKFLDEFGLQLAINGDGFSYLDQDTYDPDQYCPDGGEPVKVNSYAASRGTVYSKQWDFRPIMFINKSNEITFKDPKGAIYNAVSGDRFLVEKGKVNPKMEGETVENGRRNCGTAFGCGSQSERSLVVPGRDRWSPGGIQRRGYLPGTGRIPDFPGGIHGHKPGWRRFFGDGH